MVQYGCVKNTRGVLIPPEGKRKGGLWETKSFIPSYNLRNNPLFIICFKMSQLPSLDF